MNNPLYHFLSAALFVALGGIILLTEFLPNLSPGSRMGAGILLILWGIFRAYRGWKLKQALKNQ